MKNNPAHISLPTGKLPFDILARMLKTYTSLDNRIKIGPSIGEDATVVDMGDRYLLLKTDPITLVTEDIGSYTVKINANDIATMGAKPMWFLTSILLPEHSTTELVEKVFQQLSCACKEIGVSLCGGHTEITEGIDKPIIVGAMIGEVEKDGLITTSGARVGDDILLTKAIAVEGTSIIAREKEKDLLTAFDRDFINKCKSFLEDPGISILTEAMIAKESGEIHSMHDPTEGGLATGLFEIACAADVGIMVEEKNIPIYPECNTLCQHYGLDPFGLIASGSLLITLDSDDTVKVLEALRNEGIAAEKIGKVLHKDKGLKMKKQNEISELTFFKRDEITKIFG